MNRRLPLYVNIVLCWLRGRLKSRRSHKLLVRKKVERAALRVDAKAEGCLLQWVAGHRTTTKEEASGQTSRAGFQLSSRASLRRGRL